jgi:uncharacterized SAM-binding protein YcdF (DUF218 family)
MFELLTNLLIWAAAVPIFILLYKKIPKPWFNSLGLLVFVILVLASFIQADFGDSTIPGIILRFLTFPFSITGFLFLLLYFTSHRIYKRADIIHRDILMAFMIFAIASNNGFADICASYIEKQGEQAVRQSYRRPVLNLSNSEIERFRDPTFDIILVTQGGTLAIPPRDQYQVPLQEPGDRPWDVQLTDEGDRLIYASRAWQAQRNTYQPLIIVSGGRSSASRNGSRPPNYPCGIAPEVEANPETNTIARPKEAVRAELAELAYDFRATPNYEGFFPELDKINRRPTSDLPAAGSLAKTNISNADDMCVVLTRPPFNIPRSYIAIEPESSNLRRSVLNVKTLIERLKDKNRLINPNRENPTILLVTSAIETSRAYLSFRHEGLDVVPFPADYLVNPAERPWPVKDGWKAKPFVKLDYFFFSAEAFYKSELAWQEAKRLILYTLRFWMQPPITDEAPYFPPDPGDVKSG